MQLCKFWGCLFAAGPGVQRAGWGLPGKLPHPTLCGTHMGWMKKGEQQHSVK